MGGAGHNVKPRELQTRVTHVGQRFLDEPVLVYPKKERPSRIGAAVQAAFDPEGRLLPPIKKPIVIGHERVRLNWLTSVQKPK